MVATRAGRGAANTGAKAITQASEDVVPASQLREVYAWIRELEAPSAARPWRSGSCARPRRS